MAAAAHVLHLKIAEELRLFLPARHRGGELAVGYDGTSSLGHVVTSLGVPLTEVGSLRHADGRRLAPAYRPRPAERIGVDAIERPQPLPMTRPRFLLDVHLGTLARQLRLLGLDASYSNRATDDELLTRANAEDRVLLTQDRGLLRRRALRIGAYVRGDRPGDQLADVLDRFAPPLSPFSRCPACNGRVAPVAKDEIAHRLQPGTRRSYDVFTQCAECGRVYWRGAHAARLHALTEAAGRRVAAPRPGGRLLRWPRQGDVAG